MCLRLMIVSAGLLALASRVEAAVIYDAGSPQRPLSVTDLVFANGIFTANIDYSTSFGDTIVDPTAITGSTILTIQTALQSQLNSTNINSRPTFLVVNVDDTAPGGDPTQFSGNLIFDFSANPNTWNLSPTSGADADTTDPAIGLITFTSQATAVPEPSTYALALLCGGPLLFRAVRRRQSLS